MTPPREGFSKLSSEKVRNNLSRVEERIAAACARAGRSPDEVRLLAATKYVPPEQMAVLVEAGIRLVGENRAEDLEEKWRAYGDAFEWHFIGHLQRRKVKRVVEKVRLIHSLETIALLEELDKRSMGAAVEALVEVNVSGEQSKYGMLPTDVEAFLEQASGYDQVRISGLMTMAPLVQDPEQARPVFRVLRELRDRLVPAFASRYSLTELSMGMSNDYEVAVEEGATIVRVGSALFAD